MRVNSLTLLFRIFGKYRWHVLGLAILGFVGAILDGIGINALIPLLSFLVNNGQPTDFISRAIAAFFAFIHVRFTFRYLLVFVFGLFLTRSVLTVVFGYVRGRITGDFLASESEELMQLSLKASWPFLLRQKLGYIQTTMVRDIQRSANMLESVGQIIQSFSGFIIYLLFALNISPFITLCTLIAGAVLLTIVRPIVSRLRNAGSAMATTEKNISHFLSEHIIGMKAVKAAGVEDSAYAYSHHLFTYFKQLYVKSSAMRAMSTSLFQPFSIMFVLVLFSLSYRSGTFNLISFAATLYLIQKIFTYLESGQTSLSGIGEAVPYAENVLYFKKLLREHPEEHAKGTRPFAFADAITFSDVSLHYGGPAVLESITLTLKCGTTTALVGPSGAGKTSVADLLLRLFGPTDGKILVDGVPLEQISMKEWRAHIGYVAQDVFLLNGSIEENVRFYDRELTQEEVWYALERASLAEFVRALPEGLATVVGDRGVMLSGGQRQRIALARALARKPDVLILDEATSALDAESERSIQESIHALKGSVTVLIIAHRLSTVLDADRIVVLNQGKLTEEGSSEELLKDTSTYFYRMKQQQSA